MSRQFESGRAVEVTEPIYGSAYRIGGRLVLTASHLLAEVGSVCRVRAKQSFGEVNAKVVWKAPHSDIALIELDEGIDPCEAITFGMLPADRTGKIKFEMYGYPRWAWTQQEYGKAAAGGRQVEGTSYLADTSPEGSLVLESERVPQEKLPEKGSWWEGASGAAIVCDGLVVAVQKQHQNPQRPASLEASLLNDVYGDTEWRNLLEKNGINPDPAVVELSPGNLPPEHTITQPNRPGSSIVDKELQWLHSVSGNLADVQWDQETKKKLEGLDPSSIEEYAARTIAGHVGKKEMSRGYVPIKISEVSNWAMPREPDEILNAKPAQPVWFLGASGGGKTTLLSWLELSLANSLFCGTGHYIPWMVCLDRLTVKEQNYDELFRQLRDKWQEKYPKMPDLATLLKEGRVALLLDAVDQMVDIPDMEDRYRVLHNFFDEVILPSNILALTCRQESYVGSRYGADNNIVVMMKLLDPQQVRKALTEAVGEENGERVLNYLRQKGQEDLLSLPIFLDLYLSLTKKHNAEKVRGPVSLIGSILQERLLSEMRLPGSPFYANGHAKNGNALLTSNERCVIKRSSLIGNAQSLSGGFLESVSGIAVTMTALQLSTILENMLSSWSRQPTITGGPYISSSIPKDFRDIIEGAIAISVMSRTEDLSVLYFSHSLFKDFFGGLNLAMLQACGSSEQLGRLLTLINNDKRNMVAAMAVCLTVEPDKADKFLAQIEEIDAIAAARAAGQPECPESPAICQCRDRLKEKLLAMISDRECPLLRRCEAATALSYLGHKQLMKVDAGNGHFAFVPRMVRIDGGRYPMGTDEKVTDSVFKTEDDEGPAHYVDLTEFYLAATPVTNAEWSLFIKSGGYDNEAWWDTPDAQQWRCGIGTDEGRKNHVLYCRDVLAADPKRKKEMIASLKDIEPLKQQIAYWKKELDLPEEEFQARIEKMFPGGRRTYPGHWYDPWYNEPAQPVVGICWYEARAYCRWLSSVTGHPFRLPTEAEWEAAARGKEGRIYACGNSFDSECCNTLEGGLGRLAPVGIYPQGNTPQGLVDMTGNTRDWTSSNWGSLNKQFSYPYRGDDGREDATAGPEYYRVLRGGSWQKDRYVARNMDRTCCAPSEWGQSTGMRLASSLPFHLEAKCIMDPEK